MMVRLSDEQLAADLALAERFPMWHHVPVYLRELQEARAALRKIAEVTPTDAHPDDPERRAEARATQIRNIANLARSVGGGS